MSDNFLKQRPQTPDMLRIMDIVLGFKVDLAESHGDQEELEKRWRARIEKVIDFDSLGWQALQVALDIFKVQTAGDMIRLSSGPESKYFHACIQSFYDGFLLAAEFERLGGHRD